MTFDFPAGERRNGKVTEQIVRVTWKGECIAVCANQQDALEYVRIYGYMAEHRRLWNRGERVNWSENLRVYHGVGS